MLKFGFATAIFLFTILTGNAYSLDRGENTFTPYNTTVRKFDLFDSFLSDKTHTPLTDPSITPFNTMMRSLAVPGWGQWTIGYRRKAGLFLAAEILLANTALLHHARASWWSQNDFERTAAVSDRDTALIFWALARAIGAFDAYVGAHLRNFNVDDVN